MATWYLGGGSLGIGDKIIDLLDRQGALTAQARARYASGGTPSAAGPSGAFAQIDPEATRRAANERTSRQSAEIAAREQAAMQMAKLREDARQFDISQSGINARAREEAQRRMDQLAEELSYKRDALDHNRGLREDALRSKEESERAKREAKAREDAVRAHQKSLDETRRRLESAVKAGDETTAFGLQEKLRRGGEELQKIAGGGDLTPPMNPNVDVTPVVVPTNTMPLTPAPDVAPQADSAGFDPLVSAMREAKDQDRNIFAQKADAQRARIDQGQQRIDQAGERLGLLEDAHTLRKSEFELRSKKLLDDTERIAKQDVERAYQRTIDDIKSMKSPMQAGSFAVAALKRMGQDVNPETVGDLLSANPAAYKIWQMRDDPQAIKAEINRLESRTQIAWGKDKRGMDVPITADEYVRSMGGDPVTYLEALKSALQDLKK